MSFVFDNVTALDNLEERHVISGKMNKDRDNITYLELWMFTIAWDFENMGGVVIDCIL